MYKPISSVNPGKLKCYITNTVIVDQLNMEDEIIVTAPPTTTDDTPKVTLQTEDTGKIFEKAICDAYGIPYDGPFIYSQEEADKLVPRLKRLVTDNMFPQCVHTASKGARYDFTSIGGSDHLSAKSNKKKGGKIAPQVVGQSHPQKFCQELGIEYTTPEDLKQYIQANITTVLPMLWKYTFDSPIVYYVKDTNDIRFITASAAAPDWSSFQYVWTRPHDKWTNSSSLKVVIDDGCGNRKEETILEFQFHTKSRHNMAVRWTIDKVLRIFSGHFTVTTL